VELEFLESALAKAEANTMALERIQYIWETIQQLEWEALAFIDPENRFYLSHIKNIE
jgi:hypothetical protein